MKPKYRTYFRKWVDWPGELENIKATTGVYAFRLKTPFRLLKGSTRILYIGKCDQNPKTNPHAGLRYRLRNYLQNNSGASRRLKTVIKEFGQFSVEYAYRGCKRDPRLVEQLLLEDFEKTHLQLPPLNRSR